MADIVGFRHVTLDGYGAAAPGLNHLCRLVDGACGISGELRAGRCIDLRARRHHHLRPLRRETEAYRSPNAPAAASDEGHFVMQCHSHSLCGCYANVCSIVCRERGTRTGWINSSPSATIDRPNRSNAM